MTRVPQLQVLLKYFQRFYWNIFCFSRCWPSWSLFSKEEELLVLVLVRVKKKLLLLLLLLKKELMLMVLVRVKKIFWLLKYFPTKIFPSQFRPNSCSYSFTEMSPLVTQVWLWPTQVLWEGSSLNDQPLYGHPQYVLTGDNGLPIPITIRQWLDNPTNMNTLWSMAKKIINDLPPPRNVGDLARLLDRLFRIIRLRLQLLMELYRGRANPTIYQGQRPLIGPDCRNTVLWLVEITVLLRQLSYAIKIQLKAPKAPY